MKFTKALSIFSLAAICVLSSCKSGNKNDENATQQVEKVKVQVAKAVSRDVDQLGSFTATVEAEVTNNIAPQMSARIKKIYAEVGDRVAKGQRLAEMDDVNLAQIKLQMENNKTEFDRVDELYKIGGISKSTWDAKKLAYDVSKSNYENLLENTILLSPISGIVTKRNYDGGDMYSAGTPLYVVEQISPVKLMVHVSEALFTKVKKGMEVDVKLDVFDSESFLGTIKLVHPTIDPSTRTFPVEIKITNSDQRIRPGMFARVTFNYGTERNIVIPDRAVIKQSGSADRFVYTCDNGVAKYQKIELGQRIGDEYEVLSGIKEGQVVAITGQNRLDDGTEIEIVNS